MDEARARQILGRSVLSDGELNDAGWYLSWRRDRDVATLDGTFSADDLEAIAWWMRHKRKAETPNG